eukprot:scaffold93405_cov63-Phaeocystis_antarctica.AAC.1
MAPYTACPRLKKNLPELGYLVIVPGACGNAQLSAGNSARAPGNAATTSDAQDRHGSRRSGPLPLGRCRAGGGLPAAALGARHCHARLRVCCDRRWSGG